VAVRARTRRRDGCLARHVRIPAAAGPRSLIALRLSCQENLRLRISFSENRFPLFRDMR
jgi:hypothetical protein